MSEDMFTGTDFSPKCTGRPCLTNNMTFKHIKFAERVFFVWTPFTFIFREFSFWIVSDAHVDQRLVVTFISSLSSEMSSSD